MRTLPAIFFLGILSAGVASAKNTTPATLWYEKPASNWEHDGLPIGNGAMGAMIMGGIAIDVIQFNEKTLWTGGPGSKGFDRGMPAESQVETLKRVQAILNEKKQAKPEDVAALLGHSVNGYGDYQSFGDLVLTTPGLSNATQYHRALDIQHGLASVNFVSEGVRYRREYFASYPAGVIVVHLAANKTGHISFTTQLNVPENRTVTRTASQGRIMEEGALSDNGLHYEAQVQVIAEGGTRRDNPDGSVTVSNADDAFLILSAGTNYANRYPDYRGQDPHAAVAARVDGAEKSGYRKLLEEHQKDVAALMSRVELELGARASSRPTNVVLENYGKGDNKSDRALEQLYFQYGRYLLVSSSRAGSLPANLQGVWNPSATPPWNDDYHVNINLQMNYWLSDLTNLSEAGIPFYDFVDGLVTPGHVSAERFFGSNGWTLFLNTDIWGFSGVISWPTAFWQPEAGAWLASQYYDHYRFSLDKSFLHTRAYPVMKGASQLWLDALITDPRDGKLVVSPSYSPEHGPFSAGAAMSQQIVSQLFSDTLSAAEIEKDGEFAAKLRTALGALDRGLSIGSWGQIKEWKDDWDDTKDNHRHTSHLYALHPGNQITPLDTPDLAKAAAVTLNARGDSSTTNGEAGTGWSKAWKMNFWARLHDGDHAHHLLAQLLKENTQPNLWDAYVGPPFQIDANFGSTAGMAEMLLQSQGGYIDILPALPKAWPEGEVRGLKARGDVVVAMRWKDGVPKSITLVPGKTGELRLRSAAFAGKVLAKNMSSGRSVVLSGNGVIRSFYAVAKARYEIRFGD